MRCHCQDCLGDYCCPSLEAEVERLGIELRAANAMVLTGVDKCARADALRDEWKAAYEGTDHAAEQREWQDERDAGIESDEQLRADLARVTAERDAARENEVNALGLVDTRTNQLAEARYNLTRMASSAIEQQESRHELDKGLASMICALEADLARVTAERDALAKRWEELNAWLVVAEHRTISVGILCMKMRELETKA